MSARLCHALQCLELPVYYGCLCAGHWLTLPDTFKQKIIDEMVRVDPNKKSSGSFATSILRAIRWHAVNEGLMSGPHPEPE